MSAPEQVLSAAAFATTFQGSETTVRTVLLAAIAHAAFIIRDDATDDLTIADLAVAARAVERTESITEAEAVALANVVALGAEYMDNNDYVADADFPDDARASQILGSGDNAREYVLSLVGLPATARTPAVTANPTADTPWEVQRFNSTWGGFRAVPFAFDDDSPARYPTKEQAVEATTALMRYSSRRHPFRVYNVTTGNIVGISWHGSSIVIR